VKLIGGRVGPSQLTWAELDVEGGLESNGIFKKPAAVEDGKVNNNGYDGHIIAGAKKVVLFVPSADEIEEALVLGVNKEDLTPTARCSSSAFCIANCLAPLGKVLSETFGIINGFMTTTHFYTNDSVASDIAHTELHRARVAVQNIIPISTATAIALPRVIKGMTAQIKFQG
jgi:glyceraldehyde-3-phosphate dehydrogenase type I